jgi:hypothetical protein
MRARNSRSPVSFNHPIAGNVAMIECSRPVRFQPNRTVSIKSVSLRAVTDGGDTDDERRAHDQRGALVIDTWCPNPDVAQGRTADFPHSLFT